MSVNIPMLLQSLGAMTTAFADPQQSLQMSQNIFRQNELMRERRDRAERQRAELELARQEQQAEQDKLAEEQRRNQVAMRAYAAYKGGGNTMAAFDPGYGQISTAVYQPGTLPPMGSSATVARTAIDTGTTPFPFGGNTIDPNSLRSDFLSSMTGRPQGRYPAGKLALADMLANTGRTADAMKVLADHDEQMRQEQLKAQAPTTRQQNFEYGMSLPEGPQRDRFFDFGGQQINIGGQEEANPYRKHPMFGELKPGQAYKFRGVGQPNTDEFGYATETRMIGGQPVIRPTVIELGDPELSAEATKQVALAQSGLQAISSARELLKNNAWDKLTTKVGYALNWAGSVGSEIKRQIYDSYDTLQKLRTGAQSTNFETKNYDSIFGLSLLHSADDVEKRLQHLERAHEVYELARNRLQAGPDEALPQDVDDALQTQIRQDPKINPYARPDMDYVRHDPQRGGVIYNKGGTEYIVRYEDM